MLSILMFVESTLTYEDGGFIKNDTLIIYKCIISNLWSDDCSGGHNFTPELYSILETYCPHIIHILQVIYTSFGNNCKSKE